MQSSSASRYTRVSYSAYTPGTSTTIGSSSWSGNIIIFIEFLDILDVFHKTIFLSLSFK